MIELLHIIRKILYILILIIGVASYFLIKPLSIFSQIAKCLKIAILMPIISKYKIIVIFSHKKIINIHMYQLINHLTTINRFYFIFLNVYL
jgi:hypothetical protein